MQEFTFAINVECQQSKFIAELLLQNMQKHVNAAVKRFYRFRRVKNKWT